MNNFYSTKTKAIKFTKVKTSDKFVPNTLLFHDILINNHEFIDLLVQFNSKELSNKFFNQEVDIYAIDYANRCYGGYPGKTKCIYGGVTFNYNNKTSKQNILLGISLDREKVIARYDLVSTDKKLVTIQELDKQLREYLIKEYDIYNINSAIQRGYIEFNTKQGLSFKYDIYNSTGNFADDFLKIYNDNQIVESENVEINVMLYTS